MHYIDAVDPLEPADGEMTRGNRLEVLNKCEIYGRTLTVPSTATACAATFSDTSTPKRVATWVRKRTTGALFWMVVLLIAVLVNC